MDLENASGPHALRRPRKTRRHGQVQGTGNPEDARASTACNPESVARGLGTKRTRIRTRKRNRKPTRETNVNLNVT